jgi:hypothetical protein
LQDKIQTPDGSMVIDTRGPLPPNVEMPGQVSGDPPAILYQEKLCPHQRFLCRSATPMAS